MDVMFGTELTRYSEATNRLVQIIFYFANFSIIFYFTTSTSSKYPSFHSKWNKSIIHCCFSWSSVNYNRSSQQSRRFVVFGTKKNLFVLEKWPFEFPSFIYIISIFHFTHQVGNTFPMWIFTWKLNFAKLLNRFRYSKCQH